MTIQSRRIAKELEQFAERLVVKIGISLTMHLKDDTPKDTGWASASWILNIGSPTDQTAGSKQSAIDGNLNHGPQVEGMEKLRSSYQWPNVVYLTNNAPYINMLNAGSSKQAPIGFVQLSIAKTARGVN